MKINFIKILSAVIMLSTTMCSSVSAQNEEGVESKSEYQEYLSPIRAGVPNGSKISQSLAGNQQKNIQLIHAFTAQ